MSDTLGLTLCPAKGSWRVYPMQHITTLANRWKQLFALWQLHQHGDLLRILLLPMSQTLSVGCVKYVTIGDIYIFLIFHFNTPD